MRPVCYVRDVPGLYPDKTAKPLKPKTLLKLLCEPLCSRQSNLDIL